MTSNKQTHKCKSFIHLHFIYTHLLVFSLLPLQFLHFLRADIVFFPWHRLTSPSLTVVKLLPRNAMTSSMTSKHRKSQGVCEKNRYTYRDFSKNRGKTTKMDGWFHGKPYENWWFGGTIIFGNTHITYTSIYFFYLSQTCFLPLENIWKKLRVDFLVSTLSVPKPVSGNLVEKGAVFLVPVAKTIGKSAVLGSKNLGVSKNRGTPKSSILINHPFWGTFIFGNTHVWNIVFFWRNASLPWNNLSLLRVPLSPNPNKPKKS